MSSEMIKENEWIYVGDNRIPAYVINIISATEVSAGYYQNSAKTIKEEFILKNGQWEFKSSGPSGSYLSGSLESIVKRGP